MIESLLNLPPNARMAVLQCTRRAPNGSADNAKPLSQYPQALQPFLVSAMIDSSGTLSVPSQRNSSEQHEIVMRILPQLHTIGRQPLRCLDISAIHLAPASCRILSEMLSNHSSLSIVKLSIHGAPDMAADSPIVQTLLPALRACTSVKKLSIVTGADSCSVHVAQQLLGERSSALAEMKHIRSLPADDPVSWHSPRCQPRRYALPEEG